MKSDSDIKRDVEAELKWDPDIDATDIAVAAKWQGRDPDPDSVRGVVYLRNGRPKATPSGVAGVAGVLQTTSKSVCPSTGSERPDPEIARDAVTTGALKN